MYLGLIREIQVINSNGRITLSFVLGHTHEGLLRVLALRMPIVPKLRTVSL